jgi:integrase/recombinase XerD
MVTALTQAVERNAPAPQEPTDDRLIALWLHGRPATTQAAYRGDVGRFLAQVGKPIRQVTLGDVQGFVDTLDATIQPNGRPLSAQSRARTINAVKSLFAFALRIGYLPVNVAAVVRPPRQKDTLAERILSEGDVIRLIELTDDPRNRALLRLLYVAGLRVSELCDLTWKDVQQRENGGQITVYGKGGKTRHILLPASVWDDLHSLSRPEGTRDDDAATSSNINEVRDGFVFRSRRTGGRLTRMQVFRIVKAAAVRAGLGDHVSPHWLRHAHASIALDRGAPVHLVQRTLGHSNLAITSRYAHARPSESSSSYLAQ